MDQLQTQSIWWRIYAAFVALLVLVLVQIRPVIPGAGLNWEGAKAVYWSFGLLGLLGYAYGFRILSKTFWRVYALIFAVDITFRFMTKVGWVPVARLFGLPQESRHGTLTILFALGLVATTCVALLRYGGWLQGSSINGGPPSTAEQSMERNFTWNPLLSALFVATVVFFAVGWPSALGAGVGGYVAFRRRHPKRT